MKETPEGGVSFDHFPMALYSMDHQPSGHLGQISGRVQHVIEVLDLKRGGKNPTTD